VRIVAVGDATIASRNLRERIDSAVLEFIDDSQVRFANAEFSCPAPATPPAVMFHPLTGLTGLHITGVSEDWAIDELTSLGVNLISVANNHAGDFGHQGISDMLNQMERRSLIFAGAGRTLREAREPGFLDLPGGRVALVATMSSSAEQMLASDPGPRVAGRPGVNPMRYDRSYVLPDVLFEQLKSIDEALGTADSRRMRDGQGLAGGFREAVEQTTFRFGTVKIARGSAAHVQTILNPHDIEAICRSVREAAMRSDVVLVSMHCHEGPRDQWNSDGPAEFVVEAARRVIDAGASAVLGHGPHRIGGIEFYRERPILYSLGNFIYDFESIRRIPPQILEHQGVEVTALPAEIHRQREHDENGQPRGAYADRRYWQSYMAAINIEDGRVTVNFLPIEMGLRGQVSQRGIPRVPSREECIDIVQNIRKLSEPYSTTITYDEDLRIGTATPSL
jgi:poly-gamma-glutamate capsule biosynthesis protein CapA/YwtB (metallophosphatase superfamily)